MTAITFPPADRRLFIILGAYGTGKTEISVNLALQLAQAGRQTALCDLDIVNPYFRSRDKAGLLQDAGIRLIAPPAFTRAADLPAVPAGLWQAILDKSLSSVLDVGGDKEGARVLAAYNEQINDYDPCIWYVFNASRYDNDTADHALTGLRQIEDYAGLKVGGIIANTHLLGETTLETVLEGAARAQELSQLSGLPIVCYAVNEAFADGLPQLQPQLVLKLYMKRPWE